MQTSTIVSKSTGPFPPFNLTRFLKTIFEPRKGERICILIDLESPSDVVNFKFLSRDGLPIQKKAYDVFYQGICRDVMPQLELGACDFFAYKTTGGSNLELPIQAMAPDGKILNIESDIYPKYNIILCISTFSATAPLTAAANKYGFRGATMHGLNDIILKSGLAVDYNEVSKNAEKLRKGMTGADCVDIDFGLNQNSYSLHIDLGKQEAQKSHGLCRNGPDIANLPAGEVYFVPTDAEGSFPIKFEDGTLGVMNVENCHVKKINFVQGNQKTIKKYQQKFDSDPAASILGELGFGTQVLPYAGSDIQDEKIFGTFHIATGRNDHLHGNVTLDRFYNYLNATHDDILFSSTKTPEICIKQVRMLRNGKTEILIENYEPLAYLKDLLS